MRRLRRSWRRSVGSSARLPGPGNQHAKIGGLGEFGQFAGFGCGEDFGAHAQAGEVLAGAAAVLGIERADEFDVLAELFFHAGVFAADGAVDDGGAGALGDAAGGARGDGAVDDGEGRPVFGEVTHGGIDELVSVAGEGETEVDDVAGGDVAGGFDIQAVGLVLFADDFEQGLADFTDADDEYLFLS